MKIKHIDTCVKELQVKRGECRKYFLKKYGQFIELVLMILGTPYDVLFSIFCANWNSYKDDSKDYNFDSFYDLLIKDQEKSVDEGKLVIK